MLSYLYYWFLVTVIIVSIAPFAVCVAVFIGGVEAVAVLCDIYLNIFQAANGWDKEA